MAQQNDDGTFRFEIMIGGQYQALELDADVETFTGTEALLVDKHAGDLQQWWRRMEGGTPTGTDILLVAFLAARRKQITENGSSELVWEEFAEACAPYSLRLPGDEQTPVPNRAAKRAAARSGNPRKRSATTPAVAAQQTG